MNTAAGGDSVPLEARIGATPPPMSTSQEAARSQALDVRQLPSFAFGSRSLMWWATLGLMLIEGTVFALAVATYFYLRSQSHLWPPNEPPPDLPVGTGLTVLLLASVWPAMLAKAASERLDVPGVRLWVTVGSVLSLLVLAVRAFEFGHLNCHWDGDAYGSIVWTLLALHTLHLVTDAYDTLVLNVLFFTGPLEGKRFGDVSENAMYWYFVVFSWLPIYAVIYLAPRGA
jgi:heme/copper-type cytochrome/quinol oxidase subunit 3